MNIPVQMTGDIYWLTNPVHFANQGTFQDTKNTIDREYTKSTEEFIKHFTNSYCDPYPPSWILGELLTMGNVNMVYRNLKADKIRKRISHYFGLQPIVLESWITSLTLLPPFKSVEQGKFYHACFSEKDCPFLDNPADKPSKGIFHNLHHQVFP